MWSSLGSSTRTLERAPQGERKSRQAVRRGHPCIQPELHTIHRRGLGTDEPKHSMSCYNLTRSRTVVSAVKVSVETTIVEYDIQGYALLNLFYCPICSSRLL